MSATSKYFNTFQGYETVSTTLSNITLLLGIYPDIQEKLANELETIFITANEEVTDDHLKQMNYMNLIIKEALRIWPAIAMISRTPSADITLGEIVYFSY
jgi:cytochrome P450 family 4